MMKILRLVLLGLLGIIIVIVIAGFIVYNDLTTGPLPVHDGELTVDGLNDSVQILRDDWGIPHIYASNTHDLFFAQGYIHAQDRWWQMEFFRHIPSGRLSELVGESQLGTDLFFRTLGFQQIVAQEVESMDENTRDSLQAFADGVNAYILNRTPDDLALEYSLLGLTGLNLEIEPWTPEDSLLWGKFMAFELSGNESNERLLSKLYDSIGQELADQWAPPWPFGEKPTILIPEDLPLTAASVPKSVVDTGGTSGFNTQLAGNFTDGHLESLGFQRGEGIGSNNWVVHGNITESGKPLLANDMHLRLQMPSIWYEIGLHCQPVDDDCPFNVTGFTFSPTAAVIAGHNDLIAWGHTNVGPDTQDLYQIHINPDNELQYEWNGEWREMTIRNETIYIGNLAEPVMVAVRETHLGPIITDNNLDDDGLVEGFNNDNALALRWTALEPGTIFTAVFKLNLASNWDEFREALRFWDTPSQNIVYADTEGNIGYQMSGRIPFRIETHSGLLPVPGWTNEFEWPGFIPYDNLPRIFNPERGFVATANQAVVPLEYYSQLEIELGEGFNYFIGQQWAYGYRGQRIVGLLEELQPHNIGTFQSIQGDNKMISAEELVPYLESVKFDSEELNNARNWMLDWDYQMHKDSPQAALYAQFWASLMNNLYEDQLGDVAGSSGGTRDMWATFLLMDDPENEWWDDINTDSIIETRDMIIVRAFEGGYAATKKVLGEERDQWRWGDLHTLTFVSNPLGQSGIDLIENLVNRGPVATSGGSAIINATGWDATSGNFAVGGGPSERVIYDLSDFANSVAMHTTGQSGHPFSAHYGDMIDPWRNIEYHPMLWSREQVKQAAISTLILKPE